MPTTRRTIAVAGAVVAVGAAGLMTAGIAFAVEPGRCLENVNVRAEPRMDARIVAVCEAGTAVTTDRITGGFVQLTDLGGWAAAEYIEIDGRPAGEPGSTPAGPSAGDGPVRPTEDAADAGTGDADRSGADRAPSTRGGSRGGDAGGPDGPHVDEPSSSTDDRPRRTEEPGGLGGLL